MLNRLKQLAVRFHNDDSGAMSVEKILILAVISVPILILIYVFGGKIKGWFSTQQSNLTNEMGNQNNNNP